MRARVARTGIQPYRMADGSTRWEFRPEAEVFDADSLASFVGAPLTVGHPEAVNSASWARDAVGVVSAQPDRSKLHDGHDWIEVAIDVNRADAIEKVERGELEELSVGYRADFDPTPGEFAGQRYDGVQRNIRVNHVALLPRGKARAGREARLLTDGLSDAENAALYETHAFETMLHGLHVNPLDSNFLRRNELERMGRMPTFELPAWLQETARSTVDATNDDPGRDERRRIQQEFEAELHGIHGKTTK